MRQSQGKEIDQGHWDIIDSKVRKVRMSIPTGGLVLKRVHVRAFDSDTQNEDIGIDDAIALLY